MRVLRTILIFTGIGCLTTIAISWLAGVAVDVRLNALAPNCAGYGRATLTPYHAWTFFANRRIAVLLIGSYVESSQSLDLFDEVGIRLELGEGAQLVLPSWSLTYLPDYDPAVSIRQTQLVLATGWPWKSMSVAFSDPAPVSPNTQHAALQIQGWSGVALGSSSVQTDPPPAIPLRPIWTGLAADSAVWGAFLAAAVFVRRRLRALWRLKRGLCPACGYDLRHGEHDACPEGGRLPSTR